MTFEYDKISDMKKYFVNLLGKFYVLNVGELMDNK